jgi:dihydrofolate reductase
MSGKVIQTLSMIVAMDSASGIGYKNTLPWSLQEDLAHFKNTTLGFPMIMGRNTHQSIGRALPGRRNIVITSRESLKDDRIELAKTIEAAFLLATMNNEPSAFVIGGASIYNQAMPYVDRLIVTKIHATFQCDTFFPFINPSEWELVDSSDHVGAEENVPYSILHYKRR